MIRVESLSFTYPRSTGPAVQDLSFTVAEGEVFGFLGPSGAGKSTTQNILIGLIRGFEGSATVMGRSLTEWDSTYYRRIGVSFEFPNHYLKLTARENLELFRALHGGATESVETLLDMVGLSDAIDVRVSDFSKGMKNRLTFTRSLLHRPRLWFLDEPTAGLDPVNSRRIMEIIESRRRDGITTFLTTHDMVVADKLCDRVGFIVGGRLEVIDTPRSLRLQYGTREVRVTWEEDAGPRSAMFPLDRLADDAPFLETLRTHRIESIHSQETTLEDVFIQVTGTSLA
ncbi:MAG: ABC transporter ATP-binding protein [Gemmatimonadota bacterium]